jgi:hypothetical protein
MKNILKLKNSKWWILSLALILGGVLFAQNWVRSEAPNATADAYESENELNEESLQEAAEDIAKIQAIYQSKKLIEANMRYTLRNAQQSDSAVMEGSMALQAGKAYHRVKGFEFLTQDGKFLHINHEDKIVNFAQTAPAKSQLMGIDQIATQLLETGSNAAVEETILGSEKCRLLTMNPLSQQIETIRIWYDTNQYFIKRVEIVYEPDFETDQQRLMQIDYSGYQMSDKKFPTDLKNFITEKKDKKEKKKSVELTAPQLKNYHLNVVE